MMAEVQIHESSLDKIRIGLPVHVEVDALPGKRFTGRVAKIAPLPDAESAWLNPDLKVYPTQIHLDGSQPELRTGMSCRAEIIVEQHDDALYVPVQAVTRIGAAPTVYLREGGAFEPHAIEIGLDNNSMVHVLSGLEHGQEVLLTPPLEASGTVAEERIAAVDADTELTRRRIEESKRSSEAGSARGLEDATGSSGGRRRGPGSVGDVESELEGRRPGGLQDVSPQQWGSMRQRLQSMSPEEREAMGQRFRNMSPEEREAMRKRFQSMMQGQRGATEGQRRQPPQQDDGQSGVE
jgi:hypothetical protein